MRKKKGFALHKVCNINIIVAEGKKNVDFEHLISLNETAVFLWEKMGLREFTVADMAGALMEEYEVEQEIATKDSEAIAQTWLDLGIVEE